MLISATGAVSFYFVQFSFFFKISNILKTICLSEFALWFHHGIIVVWLSMIRRCPPPFSLVLPVCSWIWILGFQLCSKWFGNSNPYMLLFLRMIIFDMFSWLSKFLSSLGYIRFIKCGVVILFAFCFIHFGQTSLYKSVRYGLEHV